MNNISTPTPTPSPNNQPPNVEEPMMQNSNKISMNVNSTNNKIKTNNENKPPKTIADRSEEAQKSILNGLSNFFS